MSDPIGRRDFVQATAAAAVAASLGGCASLQTVRVESRGGVVRLRIADYPQLQGPGGYLRVETATREEHLVVLALRDGGYAALSPVCTHQGCTVDVAGDRLACPCHGSEYDRTGEVLRGPAERRLDRYPVEVTPDGELLIRLGTA